MFNFQSFLLIFGIFLINTVQCTEFVPVYTWDKSSVNEYEPALHKISQDSFKEIISKYITPDNPFIVVFAEQTLSPEDFAQRDQSGNIAFPQIANLKESTNFNYKPYVQNPVKALKHLREDYVEISIDKLKEQKHIPKTNLLIVDLNDARDDEHRIDMLRRHDKDIVTIYNELTTKFDKVLALYTSRHSSWVASEDVSNRQTRSLLEVAANDNSSAAAKLQDADMILYIKEVQLNNDSITNMAFTSSEDGGVIVVSSQSPKISFSFTNGSGYWFLDKVEVNDEVINNTASTIYAPFRFSYHCSNQIFKFTKNTLNLTGFQVQPLYLGNITGKFGDAYDCVGFTSVPIWSGIFVTFILLFIMTFGLTMMMDIKTMDRFDDAKGKTITINASE